MDAPTRHPLAVTRATASTTTSTTSPATIATTTTSTSASGPDGEARPAGRARPQLFPFADPGFRAHDWACAADVTVARIPRGDFAAAPRYWDGSAWTSEAAAAVPVIPTEGRSVNATQVASLDGRLVAVTKVGDWWGDTVALDVAPAAEGPWRTYDVISLAPGCEDCNTYFASFVPFGRQDASIMIGVSRNTWAGDDLARYSPRFIEVPAPPPP